MRVNWKGVAGVGAVAGVMAGAANAALDTAVTTALTSIQTDGLELIGAVTAVVIAFVAPGVIIKLIKRFSSKV